MPDQSVDYGNPRCWLTTRRLGVGGGRIRGRSSSASCPQSVNHPVHRRKCGGIVEIYISRVLDSVGFSRHLKKVRFRIETSGVYQFRRLENRSEFNIYFLSSSTIFKHSLYRILLSIVCMYKYIVIFITISLISLNNIVIFITISYCEFY